MPYRLADHAEECQAAGVAGRASAAADDPERRVEIDRADARKIRALLADGQLPQSWIPP